jgi:hypothetical protein
MFFFLPACLINISSLHLFLSLKEFLLYFLTNNLAVVCSRWGWFRPVETDRVREWTQLVQQSAYSGSSNRRKVATSHIIYMVCLSQWGERDILLLCPW